MSSFLVTVKLDKHGGHDPANKIEGVCPLSGGFCSDVTGRHHTMMVEAQDASIARLAFRIFGFHVTRVEEV